MRSTVRKGLAGVVGLIVIVILTVLLLGHGGSSEGMTRERQTADRLPVFHMDADHAVYPAVGDVSSAADVIVTGEVVSETAEAAVSPGTDALGDPLPAIPHTRYSLSVASVLKGGATSGETIAVTLSGGTTEEGKFVLDGAEEIEVGGVYMFFLKSVEGGYYPLAGGAAIAPRQPDGSFLLSADATGSKPLSLTESDVVSALGSGGQTNGSPGGSGEGGGKTDRGRLRLRIGVPRKQRIGHVLARGLVVRVLCSATCSSSGHLALPLKLARALHLATARGKHRRHVTIVARGHRRAGRRLVIKFTAQAKRRLRHRHALVALLTVAARSGDGRDAVKHARVRVTRRSAILLAGHKH